MSNSAIFIDNLFKRFGDITAVNGVSLNVWSGEFFGLLGPNGAGKTTIINILSRLLKPTSGYAIIGGYDAQKENVKIKNLIGVCPQKTAVYPYLTGIENIELFGNLYVLDRNTLKKRREVLLEKMGLLKMQKEKLKNTVAV
ncbi:MAG: ATP-binding cassette domain-containing protein [Candidatus Methanomethylicia archaeon]